jgi:hypothetical protein
MAKAVKAALTRPVTVRPRKVDHDAAPTVRRLVSVPPVPPEEAPRVVDERSGERPIAKRSRDDRKPDSGVRPSVRAAAAHPGHPLPADTRGPQSFNALQSGTRPRVPVEPELNRPLTYSFYTVAQLHLQPRAAVPMPLPTRIVRFDDVLRATSDLVRVVDQYLRTPAPRLPFMQVTAVARAAWAAEAKGFAAQWPLGKIALGFGAFFVSVFLLLVAAIAIAELTDDIPRSHRPTSTLAVAQPKQQPAPVVEAPPPPAPIAEAAPIEIDELDDVSKPAPAKAKKSAAAKTKKPFDRFLP